MARVKGGTVSRARRKKSVENLPKDTLDQNIHYTKLQMSR